MSAYRPSLSLPDLAFPEPTATSRRSLLAGAAAGIAALAATAIGGVAPQRAAAAVGDNLKAGSVVTAAGTTSGVTSTSDTRATWLVTQNGKAAAVRGVATKGIGGRFSTTAKSKWGAIVTNAATDPGNGGAIEADGGANIGVFGHSTSAIGVWGESSSSTGVQGISSAGYGVYGKSDSTHGVFAESASGTAVYVQSGTGIGMQVIASSGAGTAAQFFGHVTMNSYAQVDHVAEPLAPSVGQARIFLNDNGAGKLQLRVRFPSGASQVMATEP